MDYSKLPRPNLSGIVLAISLGVLVAVGLYQAQVRGLIPRGDFTPQPLPPQETRTIIQEENAVISASEKASPSVVAIGVSRRVVNPFDPFSIPTREEATIGTGFVVSEKGIIVTNKHVVGEEGRYSVVTKDGQKYEVRRIYRDPLLDLAIVQIDGSNLKPLGLGDSSTLKVGQTVIAIGNALGRFTNTVTTGVVSGLGRAVVAGDPFEGSFERLDNLIQTDAAINPGNSGGPLLNSAGQVIGVNVATTEGAENIGFTIPINSVKKIVDEFVAKGTVSRPFLGIRYRFISKDVAILNEVPQGAYIQEVLEDGPAKKDGVLEGDIITKIDGNSIDSENKVAEIISKANIGQSLKLQIWRDGQDLKLTAVVGETPQE
ncbi:trypsin-like peptidase domain-containing protein [Candidatus Microgenomates bacterium]|nr:trypsin-like peptidase domain-containing protein [Candidatus Microgenomates bacterium]